MNGRRPSLSHFFQHVQGGMAHKYYQTKTVLKTIPVKAGVSIQNLFQEVRDIRVQLCGVTREIPAPKAISWHAIDGKSMLSKFLALR